MNDHEKVLRSLIEREQFKLDNGLYPEAAELQRSRIAALDYALAAIGERGEPVAETCADHAKGETGFCTFLADVPFGTKLYLPTPPTQGAQPNEEKGNG